MHRLACLLASVVILSCTAQGAFKPFLPDGHAGETSLVRDVSTTGDVAAACTSPLPPPRFSFPLTTTSQFLQPYRGMAAGATTIRVSGGKEPAMGLVTGDQFCIDVPLRYGLNVLSFTTENNSGCKSEPIDITVQCSAVVADAGTPTDGGSSAATRNVAHGATVHSENPPQAGSLEQIVDENMNTIVDFGYGKPSPLLVCTGEKSVWVSLDLKQNYKVERVVLHWADSRPSSLFSGDECVASLTSCAYGKEYRVLVSDVAAPANPTLEAGDWKSAFSTTGGDGAIDEISLDKVPIRHLALWLVKNEQMDGIPGDCWEDFKLADVEVFAADNPEAGDLGSSGPDHCP